LTASIVQVLDQREKLLTNLAALKHNANLGDLEGHSVDCVLVVGRMPETRPKRGSLELFRSSLQGVRLVTFDELLGKIMLLRELLSGTRYEVGAVEDEELASSAIGRPSLAEFAEETDGPDDLDEPW
jgi:hypothetical protein